MQKKKKRIPGSRKWELNTEKKQRECPEYSSAGDNHDQSETQKGRQWEDFRKENGTDSV